MLQLRKARPLYLQLLIITRSNNFMFQMQSLLSLLFVKIPKKFTFIVVTVHRFLTLISGNSNYFGAIERAMKNKIV